MSGRERIAIIGSGISGLGAAYVLNGKYDITVYEKNNYIGGHARTQSIDYNGQSIAVDTGFIVFNHINYPNLTKLFQELNVPTHKTSMSFGFKAEDGTLEWGAESFNSVFAQRINFLRPRFYRFIFDVLKFNRQAFHEVLRNPDLTLSELLGRMDLSEWFSRYYLLPMGGAIWSTPLSDMLRFPAKFFIDFFKAHGLLAIHDQPEWYTVTGGSRVYVDKLVSTFRDRIRLSSGVTKVTRQDDKVDVTDARGESSSYDHVIFACHAPEVLPLLTNPTDTEVSIFSHFSHQRNSAVLHKSTSMMPRRRACWSSWIYHELNNSVTGPISVTYWMNYLQGIDPDYPLFVTLNPPHPIAQSDVFDQFDFYHPIYNPMVVDAQRQISALQGRNHTWYCGAYNRYGFHEDGLVSGLDVASRLGVKPSWH